MGGVTAQRGGPRRMRSRRRRLFQNRWHGALRFVVAAASPYCPAARRRGSASAAAGG